MSAKFTFLGTGASTGVPVIGCKCLACTSHNPCNKRGRPCGLIEVDGKRILIDAGPDIRQQLLEHNIDHIDALLLTHSHFDHVGGLDELRVFFFQHKKPIPCLLSSATFEEIQKRYHYLFATPSEHSNYTAQFDFHLFDGNHPHDFLGYSIQPVYYQQGGMEVTGFVMGDFAYLCDVKDYTDQIFSSLQTIDILVVSALMQETSRMHLSLQEAVDFAQKTSAHKVYFTHIGHRMEHEEGNRALLEGMELGYDGLDFTFNIGYAK